jgi:hypothetical protein
MEWRIPGRYNSDGKEMVISVETTRALDVRSGIRIEIFTIAWMVVEMAVSLSAGIAAGSVLLIAFGFESLIELLSGCGWRARVAI